VVYDLRVHGGPTLTFCGNTVKIEYEKNPDMNATLYRLRGGEWSIVEATTNGYPSVKPAALKAINSLYERYIVDIIMIYG